MIIWIQLHHGNRTLQWRHNGRDGVSTHQFTIVYSTVYSGTHQREHQSSASLAFVRGIHWSPVNSPHKWTVTGKMFPFHDVIMVVGDQNSDITSPTKEATARNDIPCDVVMLWNLQIQGHSCDDIRPLSRDPDSKVHGANMGPIWGRQDPGGSHVGPMNFVIWGSFSASSTKQKYAKYWSPFTMKP